MSSATNTLNIERRAMKGITPQCFGNHPCIVGKCCGCRIGSWGESMGHVADVC
jgi:hypothetical protein